MFRGVIKYVAFLGVLIGIGIITKVLEQVIENASIKGKPGQVIDALITGHQLYIQKGLFNCFFELIIHKNFSSKSSLVKSISMRTKEV